jgi:tellurium resistance protein TerD
MPVNLQKGQRADVGLQRMVVGVGWDPNPQASAHPYDLDLSVFMLNGRQKTPNDQAFVYYNSKVSGDGAVLLSEDDRSGQSSDKGDDESATIDLSRVRPDVLEILFVITIHEAAERRQNFGQIRNSFIRVVDTQTKQESFRFELDEDFSTETAVEFGRLYRRGDTWRFEATGRGSRHTLDDFVQQYM